ncbi:MAG: hypothetical protein MHPSP_000641 [Paramarteilia canceri]
MTESMQLDQRLNPLAGSELHQEILKCINSHKELDQLKKGINEAVKSVNRNRASLVVISADVSPVEIVLNIPDSCEKKGIPYVFIKSSIALGRACGISRPMAACAIQENEHPNLKKHVEKVKIAIDKINL